MVRTILANRKFEEYITAIAKDAKFFYGIIVGQTSSLNKDYVVHLCRTTQSTDDDGLKNDPNKKIETDETIDNFDEQNLINHSVNVTKMIPGSFYVLGIFVGSETSIFERNETIKKFDSLLEKINRALDVNKFLCGHPSNHENSGLLLLNYVPSSKTFECKSFDGTGVNSTGGIKPTVADWKFIDKPIVWHLFESSYELDEVFPTQRERGVLNMENSFLISLKYVSDYIASSEIFIQNQNVNENQSLENYMKDKVSKKESVEKFKASILQSLSSQPKYLSDITEFNGTIRYVGTVCSRIWVHQKCSFKDIQQFIRNDILRSLAARVQTYFDGLASPNATNDVIIVNIPPKRVFFDIPDSGGIQFSEYLFKGENVNTVIQQAKEILDLTLVTDNVEMEIEILPDYDDVISIFTEPSVTSIEQQEVNDDSKKYLYYGGIGFAVLVLIVSILIHFIWR